jgi:secondary thiamine-phosphate synthase enzyme
LTEDAQRHMQTILTVPTRGPGLYEFTGQVAQFVRSSGVAEGLATLFVQHTSCSLCVQENADPDVRRDLDEFLHRLVPAADQPSMQWIRHGDEGPDDMPAHIKAALMAVSLSVPVRDGKLALGQWQGIFLFEHRHQAHERTVVLHLIA